MIITDISFVKLEYFLFLAALIFVIGLIGIIANRKSLIHLFMSIELMLLAVNINFIAFSVFLENIAGQIFVLFILTVGAAEIAVGLAILVLYYKNEKNIDINKMNKMHG
jgi:NADH-quinone oxidoreductase subunit K